MSYSMNGTVYRIMETKTLTTENGELKTRDFLVKTEGEYPQIVKMSVSQIRCELLDKLKVGQNVKVQFDVRGREYADKESGELKNITYLEAWKFSLVNVQDIV